MPFPIPYDQETQLLVAEAHAEYAYGDAMIAAAQAVVEHYAAQIGHLRELAVASMEEHQSDDARDLLQVEGMFVLEELGAIETHATYDGRSLSGGGRVWIPVPDRVAHRGVDGIEIPLPTLCGEDELDTLVDISTMSGAYEALLLANLCLDTLDADALALADISLEVLSEQSAVVAEFGPVGTAPGCEEDRLLSVAIARTESAVAVAARAAAAIASTEQQVAQLRDTARAATSERLSDRDRVQLQQAFRAALDSLDSENLEVRWDSHPIAEGSRAVWGLELPVRAAEQGIESFEIELKDLTTSSLGVDYGAVSVSTYADAHASLSQFDSCLDELAWSARVLDFQAERLTTTLERLDAACVEGN